MPGYETPIKEGNALGIMCSYNMVNGKPTCANAELLQTLRGDWAFEGYITSDSDSCACIHSPHHYATDAVHAAADCLKGGTDINSGGTYKSELATGLASGVINISDARQALHNAYGFRMRLGLFDPNITDKNRDIPVSVIGSAAHHQASLEAARQSLILLKNNLGTGLPFTPGKRLVVVGSDVDDIAAIMEPGNYNANNVRARTLCLSTPATPRVAAVEPLVLPTQWRNTYVAPAPCVCCRSAHAVSYSRA